MQLRICNGCRGHYQPYRNSRGRCHECLREYERQKRQRRGSTAQRGYSFAWQALRKVQLARQPYCAECGATDDLTVDHINPDKRKNLTLNDVQVLCRTCNSMKGRGQGTVEHREPRVPQASFPRN